MFGGVIRDELAAVLLAVAVVERRQDDGGAKLSFVDQIFRLLVVGVNTHRQLMRKLLLHADVVVVGMFRQRRCGLRREWRIAGIGEQANVPAANKFEGWRRHV